MSNSEKNVIPFKRREKRDVSLSRITTETINLANFQEYYTIFGINSIKSLKKRNHSFYAKKLLTEILPDKTIKLQRKKKENMISRTSTSASSKKKKNIFDFLSLDRISEYDHKGRKIKYYTKNCNLKKHIKNGKFISNFLTPVNNFISDDFKLYNDDYKEITKKMPVKKQRKITLPLIPYKMNHVKQCKFKI